MTLTYRARRRLHKLGVALGYTLLISAIIFVCWVVWLERFVVYTDDGATFVFDYVSPEGTAQVAQPPENPTVSIYYNEGDDFVNTSTELAQLRGYYATTNRLIESVADVKTAISQLPEGSAVMLDLKSIYGNFYYSTGLPDAPTTDQIDITEVDSLIRTLTATDLYVIARIPAFRDRAYGLENTNYGLAVPAGYLWSGDDNCYWLNPVSNGALSWLVAQANELRELGFDEVVFTDFRFPDTDKIIFNSSLTRQEALEAAAATLVESCSTARFAVSFETGNPDFKLPEGRTRMYLTDVEASQAAQYSDRANVSDKAVNLVFLTTTNDTRFDPYGVMRPMPEAVRE